MLWRAMERCRFTRWTTQTTCLNGLFNKRIWPRWEKSSAVDSYAVDPLSATLKSKATVRSLFSSRKIQSKDTTWRWQVATFRWHSRPLRSLRNPSFSKNLPRQLSHSEIIASPRNVTRRRIHSTVLTSSMQSLVQLKSYARCRESLHQLSVTLLLDTMPPFSTLMLKSVFAP